MNYNERIQSAKQTMSSAIDFVLEQRLSKINTILPAKIISINGARASVQPMISSVMPNGDISSRPIIQDVPVYQLSTSTMHMYIPTKVDDIGYILLSQRDISNFKESLQEQSPPSLRFFSLSDAIFIPMGSFDKSFTPIDVNKICIEDKGNGDSIVFGGGEITIKTKTCNIESTSCTIKSEEVTIDSQQVTIKADVANIDATTVNLGGVGGAGVARVGDPVQVDTSTGQGTILLGSSSVLAK